MFQRQSGETESQATQQLRQIIVSREQKEAQRDRSESQEFHLKLERFSCFLLSHSPLVSRSRKK